MKELFFGIILVLFTQSLPGQIDTLIICDSKDEVQLMAPPDRPGYSWRPTFNLDNPTIHNPVASPAFNTLYIAEMVGALKSENLIVNPDFEEGNVGFESEYPYTDRIFTQGLYGVSTSAKDLNGIYFTDCPDHTSGSGLMMVVDGSPTEGVKVWCQTIDIKPNTQYAFSTWVASVLGANPAELQFSINDEALGYSFTAVEGVCQWRQFYQIWQSKDTSIAEICIVNKNTDPDGNDFALDDFLFAETESPTFDSTMVIIEDISFNAEVSQSPDCGLSNGKISLQPRGGSGRLTFSIDGVSFQNEPEFDNISGGERRLMIKDVTSAFSDFNTCTIDTTLWVSQNPCPVYIPNVIKRTSFNNQQFRITPHPEFLGKLHSLSIIDRWGTLLFKSDDHDVIQNGWNGITNDQIEVSTGVYGYILEILYPDGRIIRKMGDLTII